MQSKIPAQEIARALFELIARAKEEEPILAKWLEALTSCIHACPPRQLNSRKYVLAVLTEISIFAERWLLLKQLSPEKEKQFLDNLNPAESYFTEILFPAWLQERNPKLTIWKKKLMKGKLEQGTAQFHQKLHRQIQNQGGSSVSPLLLDWWMNTNLIVCTERDRCLCVQLTTASGDDLQKGLIEWEKILWHCGINRGLLLSYDPRAEHEVYLASTILSASKTLEFGEYRTAPQERKKQGQEGLELN